VHHLAVDGVSWRILFEDLETACDQLERGEAVRLPTPTASFRQWAERLAVLAASPETAAELPYWLAEPRAQLQPLPLDHAAGPAAHLRSSTQRITVTLDEGETAALVRQAPTRWEARIDEVLLAAVATAFRGWSGSPWLVVDLEGHGRD